MRIWLYNTTVDIRHSILNRYGQKKMDIDRNILYIYIKSDKVQ